MTEIKVASQLTVTIRANQKDIYEFFTSPERINQCVVDVVEFELLSQNKASWTLKEKRDLGIVFQPKYTLSYTGDGEKHISWVSESSNLEIEGSVTIDNNSHSCRIAFHEVISFDLPISKTMGLLAKTVAKHEIALGNKRYLNQVKEQLESLVVT
ncbi:hypothetical protein [Aliikangiella sp. IMCC44359]|uniref:hypothetical protein n=1 Tax=Aliikangiella sp. IMCC44359 TaxID=3459125 RepID=UPI00403ABD76